MADNTLPPVIHDALQHYQQQRWTRRALKTLCLIGGGGFLITLLMISGDAWLHWNESIRTSLSCLFWAAILFFIIRDVIRPILRRQNLVNIARQFEKQFPEHTHNNISSAVSFTQQDNDSVSPWMKQRCIALATQIIANTPQQKRKQGIALQRLRVFCGLIFIVWFVFLVAEDNRAFTLRSTMPWLNIPRPTDIQFNVEPGTSRIASGTDIILKVKTIPAVNSLSCAIRWDDGHQELLNCDFNQELAEWSLDLGPALENFSYTFHSKDAESLRYRLETGAAAEISETALQIIPPEYINQTARRITTNDADALKGSRVYFFARLRNFQLHHAEMRGEDDWKLPLEIEADGDEYLVQGNWFADNSRHFSLHLWNQKGLHHQHPQQWFIRVTDDNEPLINIDTDLPASLLSSASDAIHVNIQAKDDVSIEKITLTFGNQHQTLDHIDIPIKTANRTINKRHVLHLSQWQHATGDRLWLTAHCTDSAGQQVSSDTYEWIICDADYARRARQAHRLQHMIESLSDTQFKASLLTTRWSDIRSNIRTDDMHAQSGDLLQADQQMTAIQKQLSQFKNNIAELRQTTVDDYRKEIDSLHSLTVYCNNIHCLNFLNRGANILQTQPANLQSVLENSVIDSELLADSLNNVLDLTRSVYSHHAVDILETRYQLNNNFISSINGHILGKLLWKEPLYNSKLRSEQFNNSKLEGKAIHENEMPVAVSNTNIPDIGLENFSISWKGEIFLPEDGNWEFDIVSDDGIQINIDDNNLLSSEAWRQQATASFSSSLILKQGWHRIHIKYFQASGPSTLTVKVGLKDKDKKDINKFKMRSPAADQLSQQISSYMLTINPRHAITWDQADNAIQDIVDTALYMHEWAIDLSLPQLHRTGHAFTKACQPYTLDQAPHERNSLRESLKWKPKNLSNYFNEARDIIKRKINDQLLPIERSIVFDDLLLHISIMEQKSRQLKDWGLPYEYIAQTHKFLQRMKEQALTLHRQSIADLVRLSSDTRRGVGERMEFLQLASALNNNVLNDIQNLNIDNHDIIWQLPALRDALMKLRGANQSWRSYEPLELYAALYSSNAWLEHSGKGAASLSLHGSYQDYLHKRYSYLLNKNGKTEELIKWKAHQYSPPQDILALIEQHVKNMNLKTVIANTDIRQFWQLSLLNAEYHFENHNRLPASAALYVSLSLESFILSDENELNALQLNQILKTARSIAKGNEPAIEELYLLIMQHKDQELQTAVRLFVAQQESGEQAVEFLALFKQLKALPPPHCAWQSRSEWHAELERLEQQSATSLSDIELAWQSQRNLTLNQMRALHKLLEQTDDVSGQRLRWQTLHKDIGQLLQAAEQQSADSLLQGGFNSMLELEAQLAIYCQEQAQYTRKRFAALYVNETNDSLARLHALLQLQKDCHQRNATVLTLTSRYLQQYRHLLQACMSFPWMRDNASTDDESARLLQQLNKVKDTAKATLLKIKQHTAALSTDTEAKQYKRWQQLCQKSIVTLQQLVSDQTQLTLQLNNIDGQNRTALLLVLTDIEKMIADAVVIIHQQEFYPLGDSKTWNNMAVTLSSVLQRNQHQRPLSDESLTLVEKERHRQSDGISDPAQTWIELSFINAVQNLQQLLDEYQQTQLHAPVIFDDVIKNASANVVDFYFAHTIRSLYQQGEHVESELNNNADAQNNNTLVSGNDYQKRYEQKWLQSKTLIKLRAQYEYYDLFTNEQKSLIFDYFNAITESTP